MTVENFHAGTQYGDFKGSAVADKLDVGGTTALLKERGLMQDGETMIGIDVWSGEVHVNQPQRPLVVTVLLAKLVGFENFREALQTGEPLDVRRVKLELEPMEFFSWFKRFSITLSPDGILERKDIRYED